MDHDTLAVILQTAIKQWGLFSLVLLGVRLGGWVAWQPKGI
jgi:hypothetical protein